MIINQTTSPISEYYVYKVSDFGNSEYDLNLYIDKGSVKSFYNLSESVSSVVAKGLNSFVTEAYDRIIYFSKNDLYVYATMWNTEVDKYKCVLYLAEPYVDEFCEKYGTYIDKLEENRNNLLLNLKSYTRNKVANADTPVNKKFDEKFTIDDYISFLNLNYSENESEYAPMIDKLNSIKESMDSLSKELKELLECELIVYNSGIESELI